MFIRNKYQGIADKYREMAGASSKAEDVTKYKALEKSASDMAANEEWLKNNYDNTLHPDNSNDTDVGAFAVEEEHVLRCLGASVLMQWNDIPTTIQRQIFDYAGAMGELKDTATLRGQIARFLNRHKDGSNPTELERAPS